jgi:hypothetical protein
VNINPAQAAAVQGPVPNEANNIAVRNAAGLMHPFIRRKKLPAAATIADEEFPVNEFVPGYFIEAQKFTQMSRIGRPVGEEPNPHGRIDQDHQPARRFAGFLSRRLGTLRAWGSDPRSARRRS